jgi:hypothetical protein
LQSLCQFVNDDLSRAITELYQMIVTVLASLAADVQSALQRRI